MPSAFPTIQEQAFQARSSDELMATTEAFEWSKAHGICTIKQIPMDFDKLTILVMFTFLKGVH